MQLMQCSKLLSDLHTEPRLHRKLIRHQDIIPLVNYEHLRCLGCIYYIKRTFAGNDIDQDAFRVVSSIISPTDRKVLNEIRN